MFVWLAKSTARKIVCASGSRRHGGVDLEDCVEDVDEELEDVDEELDGDTAAGTVMRPAGGQRNACIDHHALLLVLCLQSHGDGDGADSKRLTPSCLYHS